MSKILILGRNGQVGSNLVEMFSQDIEANVFALDRDNLDLSQPKYVFEKLKALQLKPDVIINCAAYTAVDKAEEERELCENINYTSVVEVTRFAQENESLLIHYSSDYVFDGEGNYEFSESNTRNLKPLNFYGQTKLDAERAIQNYNIKHLILRTSWVYNHVGKNFLRTILKLSQEREELTIVDDQVGSPTYAYDIAKATIELIKAYQAQTGKGKFGGEVGQKKDGLYHLVPKQQVSWFEFTNMILAAARRCGVRYVTERVLPIHSDAFPAKAKRPHNSRLNTDKLEKEFGIKMPTIEQSLERCIGKVVQNNW